MAVHTASGLAFWHMPKTGGFSVYQALRELGENPQVFPGVGRHRSISEARSILSEAGEKRTWFGVVRNPWDWYCSLFEHTLRSDPEVIDFWTEGTREFADAVYYWTHPWMVVAPIPNVWCPQISSAPKMSFFDLQDSSQGLATWMFRHVYGQDAETPRIWLNTQRLNEGLSELLGAPLGAVGALPAQNVWRGPDTTFGLEVKHMIDDGDGDLIRRFGFQFGKKPEWVLSRDG